MCAITRGRHLLRDRGHLGWDPSVPGDRVVRIDRRGLTVDNIHVDRVSPTYECRPTRRAVFERIKRGQLNAVAGEGVQRWCLYVQRW